MLDRNENPPDGVGEERSNLCGDCNEVDKKLC
jgi:hypothetical protein